MLVGPILGAGLLAQILKGLIPFLARRSGGLGRVAELETFPNFHAVLAGALSFQVGEEAGAGSANFALATLFAVVLLYDTSGVKRAAGRQAGAINQLRQVIRMEKPLSELIGQSPARTWAAALLGVGFSWAFEQAWLALLPGA